MPAKKACRFRRRRRARGGWPTFWPTLPPAKTPMIDHRLADSQTGLQSLQLDAVEGFLGGRRLLRPTMDQQDKLGGMQRRLANCRDGMVVVRHVKRLSSWSFQLYGVLPH
jgi:hypothetical protein